MFRNRNIIELADELLLKICGDFSIQDLCSFALVCKQFNLLASDNHLWKPFLTSFDVTLCQQLTQSHDTFFKNAFHQAVANERIELATRYPNLNKLINEDNSIKLQTIHAMNDSQKQAIEDLLVSLPKLEKCRPRVAFEIATLTFSTKTVNIPIKKIDLFETASILLLVALGKEQASRLDEYKLHLIDPSLHDIFLNLCQAQLIPQDYHMNDGLHYLYEDDEDVHRYNF